MTSWIGGSPGGNTRGNCDFDERKKIKAIQAATAAQRTIWFSRSVLIGGLSANLPPSGMIDVKFERSSLLKPYIRPQAWSLLVDWLCWVTDPQPEKTQRN